MGITWDGIWNEERTMLIFLLQNIKRPGNIRIVPIVLQYLLIKLNFDMIKIKLTYLFTNFNFNQMIIIYVQY